MTHEKIIKCPIYKTEFAIILTDDKEYLKKYNIDLTDDKDPIHAHCCEGNYSLGGVPEVHQTIFCIVLNPNSPLGGMTPGVIAHEALHAISMFTASRHIKFDPDNDEPFAYYLEFLVDEIYNFLKEIEGK